MGDIAAVLSKQLLFYRSRDLSRSSPITTRGEARLYLVPFACRYVARMIFRYVNPAHR
jgi:hypothetical protein